MNNYNLPLGLLIMLLGFLLGTYVAIFSQIAGGVVGFLGAGIILDPLGKK